MKTSILFILLFMTNFALARPLAFRVYRAPISSVNFQEHSILSHDLLEQGSVSVNISQQKVSLALILRSDCPSGVFLQEWKIDLPLRSVYTSSCGVKIFKATTLLGSMSTIYQELLIMDYSGYRCRERRADFATEIEFKQIDFSPSTAKSIQQRLSLKAPELRLTF